VWVLLNQNGTFGAPVLYTTLFSLSDVGDFDLDGDVDLVGGGGATLRILLNDGTGSFPTSVDLIGQSGVRAGDFTGDGRPDLLTLTTTTKALFGVYRNTG
jgi:hypothetical protein